MSVGTLPIPWWMSDPDYYPRNDPRRAAHLARIATQRRLNVRIDAAAGDQSYAVLVRRADMEGE
ncbi:MAG: hypothetical protein EPN91_05535 [Salinibacterium sp.]|nr:MAG: hypothetical protein EPN91_05535 [Salinibacterium sp.]